ncbi:MAG: hypothetical protein ACRELX_10750 [Longimicrobiales bacterium]
MLTLPASPRRAQLRAFGLVASLCAASIVAVVLQMLDVPAWPAAALFAGALPGSAVWLRPDLAGGVYAMWNRCARVVTRLVRLTLLAASYFVVVAAGRSRSWLVSGRARDAGSSWKPRPAATNLAFESLSHRAGHADRGWIRALGPANRWMLPLVPYFVLLGRLDGGAKSSLGKDVYTLY